jgi:catechol 2,3-dioxygenase-like lactoylglutathione lyase family enzyme
MQYRSVTHVALRVADLRQAEDFYMALFDLQVAFREAEVADGWRTLPEGAGWQDAQAAGISLDLSVLHPRCPAPGAGADWPRIRGG